jgi:SAM-dependent methyltransferase
LAAELWGDRAAVADLEGPHLEYLRDRGIRTFHWDLLSNAEPFQGVFDRVFLCEVMAHVPAPPHTYLNRLRRALRPGGRIIVTTPNLYRLRNVASMLLGAKVFDRFALPEAGQWGGGFIDFSRDHLHWQLEAAG